MIVSGAADPMPMGLQCIKPEVADKEVEEPNVDLGLAMVKADEPVSDKKPRATVKARFVMIILHNISIYQQENMFWMSGFCGSNELWEEQFLERSLNASNYPWLVVFFKIK